jgi:hypothetical protein
MHSPVDSWLPTVGVAWENFQQETTSKSTPGSKVLEHLAGGLADRLETTDS